MIEPRVPPPSAAAAPLQTAGIVYLDDLPEIAFECKGQLGKHGLTRDGKDLNWLGQKPSHSLFTHPLGVHQPAWVTYPLDGRYAEFRTTVGAYIIPDSPLIFRIFGDDKPLWESKPQAAAQVGVDTVVDVRGVKVLKLEAFTPGSVSGAHAVWIDPRLTPVAPPAADVVYLDDLPEIKFKGSGFGKRGLDDSGKPIDWRGQQPAHSLWMRTHTETVLCEVTYSLDGKFAALDATVGHVGDKAETPLIFRVLGDGRELWKSPPIQLATGEAVCSISVAGVRELQLEVRYNGGTYRVAAAWIEPRLTPIAIRSEPRTSVSGPAPPPAVFPFDAATALKHQEAWAQHLGVPVEFTNTVGMKFRLIPPGEFQMGLGPEFTDEELILLTGDPGLKRLLPARPAHPVRITRPFYMEVEEVTVGRYRDVVGQLRPEMDQDPNAVLTHGVAWPDTIAFCNRLSEREGKRPAYLIDGDKITPIDDADGYRLPTEAQWEYACRAGTNTLWYFGDDGGGGKELRNRRAAPNPFGLTGLYGGSSEWCWDASDGKPYATSTPGPQDDPRKDVGNNRIKRGGSNNDGGGGDRVSINSFARAGGAASETSSYTGFGRVVLPIPLPAPPPTPSEPRTSVSGPAADPAAVPIPPGDSPGAKTMSAAPRWPLAPSKPEDIVWLQGLKATLTLRSGRATETVLKPTDAPPAAPATIVGIALDRSSGLAVTDDALRRVATLVDLESLQCTFDGNKPSPVTKDGLPHLAALKDLRRLALGRIGPADTDPAFLAALTKLESLALQYTAYPGWERQVARLSSLQELRLHNVDKNVKLEELGPLPRLTSLNFGGYQDGHPVRLTAAQRFAKIVPWCRITLVGMDGDQGKEMVIESTAPPPNAEAAVGSQPILGPAPTIDLLPLIDVKRDAVVGTWSKLTDGVELAVPNGPGVLELPYAPPEEYDFEIEFSPTGKGLNVNQYLFAQGSSFAWKLNSHGRQPPLYGFELLDGKQAKDRPEASTVIPIELQPGTRYRSRVEVRRGSLRAFLDDKEIVAWTGDFKRFTIEPINQLPHPGRIGIGSYKRGVKFYAVSVREVLGRGTFADGVASPAAPGR